MKEEQIPHNVKPPGPVHVLDDILDVIIVGAGPCGLAVAARLSEPTPAALFTDEEHRRYQWLHRHGRKVALKNVKNGKVSRGPVTHRPWYRTAVLDSTDDRWMTRWNTLFRTYAISHLRSPMLWHVDPGDRDSLLSFAHAGQRQGELIELRGCVGQEISKHKKKVKMGSRRRIQDLQSRIEINERDRNDYFTPSQDMFREHCFGVRDKYNLGNGLVSKENVHDISFSEVRGLSTDGENLFTVTTNNSTRYARAVVLAVGPANPPKIPSIPGMPEPAKQPISGGQCQSCHSMHINTFPDPIVTSRAANGMRTNIMVVGGGLTSAQLTDLAIRRGVARVWHVMRGACKVKFFDVDLSWMGKYKNSQQAEFWAADTDDERLRLLREARAGGSVTPIYHKKLKKHIVSGRLELRTHTTISKAQFIENALPGGGGQWKITTEPPIADLPMMDYIYWATGIESNFTSLPYLQNMMADYPVAECGGLPCLNNDLMWRDDVPLFVAGRLASLRIGPAAPNLGGAKVAAERIALAIGDWIPKDKGRDGFGEEADDGGHVDGYLSGAGSKYSCLELA